MVIHPPWGILLGCLRARLQFVGGLGFGWFAELGAFFHAVQLVLPVAFEGFSPFVQGPDGGGIGAIKAVAAVAADAHQIDAAQHAKVLGDGGLVEAEAKTISPTWRSSWRDRRIGGGAARQQR